MDYESCLLLNLPGAQWSISGTYESLVFHDGTPKPTEKQFEEWNVHCLKRKAALELIAQDESVKIQSELEAKIQAKMALL